MITIKTDLYGLQHFIGQEGVIVTSAELHEGVAIYNDIKHLQNAKDIIKINNVSCTVEYISIVKMTDCPDTPVFNRNVYINGRPRELNVFTTIYTKEHLKDHAEELLEEITI